MIKKLTLATFMAVLVAIFYFVYPYAIKYDLTIVGRVDINDSMPAQTVNAVKLYSKYFKINAIKIRSGSLDELDKKTKASFKTKNQLGRFVLFEDTITEYNNYDNIYNELLNKQLIKLFKRKEQVWITYSMFESTKIPNIWVSMINQFFDMVVVPDHYYIDVYKNSGVKKPIFYIPLTLNLENQLLLPIKTKKNELFTYMNLSYGRYSKNQLKLIEAFNKVQKIKKNVQLLINSRYVIPEIQEEIINYIRSSDIKNIQYTVGKLPKEDYLNFLQKADCFVYPSRGEGFSIQPREAMAMGVPTIISNNTAHQTICASGLVECIRADIERAAYYDIWHKTVIGNDFDCNLDEQIINATTSIVYFI